MAQSSPSRPAQSVPRPSRLSPRAWWTSAIAGWVFCLFVVEAMAWSVAAQPQEDRVLWVWMLAVLPVVPLAGTAIAAALRSINGGRAVWRDTTTARLLLWTSLVLAMLILPLPTSAPAF